MTHGLFGACFGHFNILHHLKPQAIRRHLDHSTLSKSVHTGAFHSCACLYLQGIAGTVADCHMEIHHLIVTCALPVLDSGVTRHTAGAPD